MAGDDREPATSMSPDHRRDTNAGQPTPRRSLHRSILIVVTCTLAMIINVSNTTFATISLPTIGREFNVPVAKLQWVVSAYSLAAGCLLLFFGRVADLHGRKRLLIIGLSWLIASALGCAFSNNLTVFAIIRGFQGVGSAAVIPSVVGILSRSFPPSRARAIAFTTFAAGAPVGGAIGSIIGSVLTEFTPKTWRSTFYMAAGLAAMDLILAIVSIEKDGRSPEIDRRIDWIGTVLVTSGLILVFYVLASGEVASKRWATPHIIALLVIAPILLCAFVLWQFRLERVREHPDFSPGWLTPPPLMKPSFWARAHGRMAAIMFIGMLTWCTFIGWNFWLQLYYQRFLGIGPILTSARLMPLVVAGILCNAIVAMVVSRLPVVYLLGFGTLMASCAALLFATIIPSASYWAFGFPAASLVAVGTEFTFSSGTLFIAGTSLPHEQSVGGALFQTMIHLGTTMGVTITTVVFDKALRSQLKSVNLPLDAPQEQLPRDRLLKCYHLAQWTAFAFGITGVYSRSGCLITQHCLRYFSLQRCSCL
ncbi:hypothetical protein HGRIS_009972 [Hohenbuehelia grisea]|uniref:Major facilitator superfamily (MFS) profile domain-containing protein n=1 Tax=Hohenbuehelia grisea TaxID=104357 RepID=A0ABR3J372_9AGAR